MLREEARRGMAWEIQRHPLTDYSFSDEEPTASRNTAPATKLGTIAYLPASSDDASDQEHDSRLLGMIEHSEHECGNATVTKLLASRDTPAEHAQASMTSLLVHTYMNTAPVPKLGTIERMLASDVDVDDASEHECGNATVTKLLATWDAPAEHAQASMTSLLVHTYMNTAPVPKLGTIERMLASDVDVDDASEHECGNATVTKLLATWDAPAEHAQASMTSRDSGNATVTKLGPIRGLPASDASDHHNGFVSSEPDTPHARKGRPVKRREDYSGSPDTRRHKSRRAARRRRYTNRGSQGTRIGRPITHDGVRHARRRQRYAKGVQAKRILPYLAELENVSGLPFERMVAEYGTTRELKGTLHETAAKLKLAQAASTTILGRRSRFKRGIIQNLCNEHGMATADVETATTIPRSTVRDYRPRDKDAGPGVERNTRKRSKVNANNDLRNQAHPPNVTRNKMSPGEESAITEHAKTFMYAPSGSNNSTRMRHGGVK